MDNQFIHSDDGFWARWLAGELSEEEIAKLDPEELRKMEQIRDVAGQLDPGNWDEENSWKVLQDRLIQPESLQLKRKKSNLGSLFYWSLGIAASLLVGIVSWIYIHQTEPVEVITGLGEHQRVFFPDSSIVIINAESQISYVPDSWNQSRTVNLEGEAYFEVKEGNTFTVTTSKADVIVLGTSFNINTRADQHTTICYTGKVQVANHELERSEILTSRMGVMVSDEWKVFSLEKETNAPGWINGKFTYQSIDFVEVIDELERQFGKQIVSDVELETIGTYTGYFFKDDLSEALKSVCDPVGLKYEVREDGTIHLSKL